MDDTRFLADFLARHNAGEVFKYVYFWGDQPGRNGVSASCLSQWYDAPFVIDGERYLTAEHFMMAEKAALFGDDEAREQIRLAPTPGTAKAWGRRIRGFDEGIWAKSRFAIVVRGNVAKFSQHPDLGDYLRNTGARILVEASPIDPVWGIGMARDDARIGDPNRWNGLNLLGFALMQVRHEIGALQVPS